MRSISVKKGSALLMVLGMIAFMIVSALGFAAYMRYSRLPSSYLRRATAARQLAKAGLARAIDDIDLAINLNPHPGIGINQAPAILTDNPPGNYWKDRVFMGYATNVAIDASAENPGGRWSQTVPVLTLEGLAYIPPTLVNSARVYSRITSSAEWHNLDYDAGRYAYVAIDVSDYFDVNRMICNRARSSTADRRVAFSYLFENARHESVDDAGAQKFDDFLNKFREPLERADSVAFDYSQKTPLVSVADLNLALWRAGGSAGVGGKIRSPFCDYMQGNNGYAGFYGITGKGMAFSEMYEMTSRHTFVTDGLYPEPEYRKRNTDIHGTPFGASSTTTINAGELFPKHDVGDGRNQPFRPQCGPGATKYNVWGIVDAPATGPVSDEYNHKLSSMGMLALADYLDLDSNPLSLALPTFERCPMIAAVQPMIASDHPLILKRALDPDAKDPDRTVEDGDESRKVERKVKILLDETRLRPLLMTSLVNLDVVFPFTHTDDEPANYAADGKVTFFFSTGGPTLRTGSTGDPLHVKDENSFKVALDLANGLFTLPFGGRASMNSWARWDKDPVTELDTVKEIYMPLAEDFNAINTVVSGLCNPNKPLVELTYQWTQTRTKNNKGVYSQWTPTYVDALKNPANLTAVKCSLKPLSTAAGYAPDVANFADAVMLQRYRNGEKIELDLNVAVWARLTRLGNDARVVDMVPACMPDDVSMNGDQSIGPAAMVAEMYFNGKNYPLMRFDTGVKLQLGYKELQSVIDGSTAQYTINVDPKAVVCPDPRFNFAPEHWLGLSTLSKDDTLHKNDWYDNCHVTDPGRDGDIFLATSDQGYLQSPYELAFIPRFTNLYQWENIRPGADILTGYFQNPGYSGLAAFTKDFKKVENVDLMWTSYDPFDVDCDAFADLGITARGHGIKVNPFSDSTNILMAAFANAPSAWRFASTNNQQIALEELSSSEFNSRYAINGYSSDAKNHVYFPWANLTQLAGAFSSAVRANNGDWEKAYESLDWTSDPDALCGVPLDSKTPTLWGVDRKFLYGYWHDCFSADQQLFLIFVRAEPSMMGGEITGQVPPNLGARAVALVWRDPRECMANPVGDYGIPGYPHKTRILFYHSLD